MAVEYNPAKFLSFGRCAADAVMTLVYWFIVTIELGLPTAPYHYEKRKICKNWAF